MQKSSEMMVVGVALAASMGADVKQFVSNYQWAEPAVAKWNADASLRAEFGNDFGRFLAYDKAESQGRARIYSNGSTAEPGE